LYYYLIKVTIALAVPLAKEKRLAYDFNSQEKTKPFVIVGVGVCVHVT
jgi:hypothetical protein